MSNFTQHDLKNFKIIIIGRSAVGKSTLLLRYVQNQFNPQKPTIGIDYRFKKVQYKGISFNLQLWDSAGQQRYRKIVYNYFNLSKAACIVFDLTNQQSLTDAKMWLQQLVLHCGNDIPKVLIANKCDLLDAQKMQQQLDKFKPIIQELKQQYQCQFFTTSAYDGSNVQEVFNYLIKQLYEKSKLGDKRLSELENQSPVRRKQVFKIDKKSLILADEQKKNNRGCC